MATYFIYRTYINWIPESIRQAMQAVRKWFQSTVQSRLPSHSYVRSLLLICLLVFIAVVVLIVSFHRYKHAFWYNKPMAWTTILPSKTGIIQQTVLPTNNTATIPNGYALALTMVNAHQQLPQLLLDELATLWNTTVQAIREESLWTSETTLLRLYATSQDNSDQLVGSLMWMPARLHTPVDDGVDIVVARRLVVHPNHRGLGLAPAMMEHALQHLRKTSHGREPVVLFAIPAQLDKSNNNRLPFSEIARTLRMSIVVNPTLLVDPDADVSHQVVEDVKNLPDKASECSQAHIETKMTIEPDADHHSRVNHWKTVVSHSTRRLLSIGGSDWIHLTHLPNAENRPFQVVMLNGCSFDISEQDQIIHHLVRYIKTQCAEDTSVKIVIPHPIVQSTQSAALTDATNATHKSHASPWSLYDAHHIYMYNYKLNPATIHLPLTMDIELV